MFYEWSGNPAAVTVAAAAAANDVSLNDQEAVNKEQGSPMKPDKQPC